MIRNVIFDWSGTLVDDLPAVWQATNFVFQQAGVNEMTLDEFRAEFCLPFTRFYERHVAHVPLPQLESWFHGCFRQVQDSVTPLPHARDFLEFCRHHQLRTFVLSTVHPDHFAVQASATGFDALIETPYLGVWDKRERIHQLLRDHHLAPAETLFIGDMQHDIETAQHGGVFSCAVLTGYNRLDQLRAAQPDLIVEHLGELRDLLTANRLAWPPQAHAPSPPFPIPTVGGLIQAPDGRFLMIRTRKWSHLWGIPGGKIQWGETAEAALRRELLEETGLPIENPTFVLVQDCIRSQEFYREAHFLLLNYTCRTPHPHVTLNDEAEAFRWVTLDEAFALPLNRPTRILLEAVAQPNPNPTPT